MSGKAFCELNDKGTRIRVFFPFNVEQKDAIKAIPGSHFVGKTLKDGQANPEYDPSEGVHWTIPATIESARALRSIFGSELTLGNAVRAWGQEEVQRERNLGKLATADDATLTRVPRVAPRIATAIRPYQRADAATMSLANMLNACQPGTGKTLSTLAAVVEADLDNGPQLVCAPMRSLENVWKEEIEHWLGHKVYTAEDPKERRIQVELGAQAAAAGEQCWVLVNFDMLRLQKLPYGSDNGKVIKRDHRGNRYVARNPLQALLFSIEWNTFTIDEFHMAGLNNPLSLFTLGTGLVKASRHYRLSGTPMGGKPVNLFPVLRSIEPQKFSNKWNWIDRWLEVVNNGYGNEVRGIKPGLEDQFYTAHAKHMVRRLKRESLPGLPAKVIKEVRVPMTTKQRKQYQKFAKDAEIRISGTEGSLVVIGDCILAQFTRLKQFANAYCTLDKEGRVVPTEESGKLPHLLEQLDEFGIRKKEWEPGARAIVASESSRMVEMVTKWLRKQGIDCDSLTGDTKDSRPIIKHFKDKTPKPYVICMTTQTGGVSLNLEETNSIHILDEMWNPDRIEQLMDRGDRGSRTTPLVCLIYRTRRSIQEYIARVAEEKKITNRNALDVYRQIEKLKAQESAE